MLEYKKSFYRTQIGKKLTKRCALKSYEKKTRHNPDAGFLALKNVKKKEKNAKTQKTCLGRSPVSYHYAHGGRLYIRYPRIFWNAL